MSNVSLAQSQVYALGYGARRRLSFALLVHITAVSCQQQRRARGGRGTASPHRAHVKIDVIHHPCPRAEVSA